MIHVIRVFVLVLTSAIWTVIGLIFWIPFLSRAIAVFTTSVLYHTAVQDDISHAQHYTPYLESAMSFYGRGFEMIMATYNRSGRMGASGTALATGDDRNSGLPPRTFHFWRIVMELFTTALFWLSVIWTVAHWRDVSAFNIFEWLREAWSALLQRLVQH